MTRSPCCDKQGLKKGPWVPEEDEKLVNYVNTHGEGNWSTVPKKSGLLRCGKSCRLRWANYLRPDLKRGTFSDEEEQLILSLHKEIGNRWAKIALELPGRTDNDIKNYWNTRIKRKLRDMGIDPNTHLPISPTGSGKPSAKASRRGPPPGESSRRLLRGSKSTTSSSEDGSVAAAAAGGRGGRSLAGTEASPYASSDSEDSEGEEEEEEKDFQLSEADGGGGGGDAGGAELDSGRSRGPRHEGAAAAIAPGSGAAKAGGGGSGVVEAGERRPAKRARGRGEGGAARNPSNAIVGGDETELSSEEENAGGGGGVCSVDSEQSLGGGAGGDRSDATSDAGSLEVPASPKSVIRSSPPRGDHGGASKAAAAGRPKGSRPRLSVKIPGAAADPAGAGGAAAAPAVKEEAVVLVDSAGLGIFTPTLLQCCPWSLDADGWGPARDAAATPLGAAAAAASFAALGLPSPRAGRPSPESLISDLTSFDRPPADGPPPRPAKLERLGGGGGGGLGDEDDELANWYLPDEEEGLAAAVEAASGRDLFECDSLFHDDISGPSPRQALVGNPAPSADAAARAAGAPSWAEGSSNWSSLGSGLQEVYGLQEALLAQQQQQQQQQQQRQQAAAAALCLPALLDLFQSSLANPPPPAAAAHRWAPFPIQQQL